MPLFASRNGLFSRKFCSYKLFFNSQEYQPKIIGINIGWNYRIFNNNTVSNQLCREITLTVGAGNEALKLWAGKMLTTQIPNYKLYSTCLLPTDTMQTLS